MHRNYLILEVLKSLTFSIYGEITAISYLCFVARKSKDKNENVPYFWLGSLMSNLLMRAEGSHSQDYSCYLPANSSCKTTLARSCGVSIVVGLFIYLFLASHSFVTAYKSTSALDLECNPWILGWAGHHMLVLLILFKLEGRLYILFFWQVAASKIKGCFSFIQLMSVKLLYILICPSLFQISCL